MKKGRKRTNLKNVKTDKMQGKRLRRIKTGSLVFRLDVQSGNRGRHQEVVLVA